MRSALFRDNVQMSKKLVIVTSQLTHGLADSHQKIIIGRKKTPRCSHRCDCDIQLRKSGRII